MMVQYIEEVILTADSSHIQVINNLEIKFNPRFKNHTFKFTTKPEFCPHYNGESIRLLNFKAQIWKFRVF